MKVSGASTFAFSFVLFALFFTESECSAGRLAPLFKAGDTSVPGEYIVLVKPQVSLEEWSSCVTDIKLLLANTTTSTTLNSEDTILKTWIIGDSFKGLHIKTSSERVGSLRAHPLVELIEENQEFSLQACNSQNKATWNLQRINARAIEGMNGKYAYNQTAADIDIYIIDSGVLTTHQEFNGRATWGANFVGDGKDEDCSGHGTHVAGIAAGRTVGVARGANVIGVKVLTCWGTGLTSTIISGMEYTVKSAKQSKRKSLANISIAGRLSPVWNQAVAASVDAGVPIIVAAGNSDNDACYFSPSSEPKAVTVGATFYANNRANDIRAKFSNWGSCVDILAPGQQISSAWHTGNKAYHQMWGTSMAAPHVAGVFALTWADNPSFTPKQVTDQIISKSSPDAIQLNCASDKPNCLKTPNKLLFTARC